VTDFSKIVERKFTGQNQFKTMEYDQPEVAYWVRLAFHVVTYTLITHTRSLPPLHYHDVAIITQI